MGKFKQHPLTKITELKFKIYSDEEITKLSVVNITNDESINSLGHYLQDGIYDLRLGPMSTWDDEICKTCLNKARACSGHCGHIILPIPVFNPFLVKELEHLLKNICPSCCRIQVLASRALQFIYECKLISEGYTTEALQIGDLMYSFLDVEAEEMNFNDGESYVKESLSKKVQKKESLSKCLKLKENLQKYYLEVKGSRPSDNSTTSNTQFAYQNIYKKFQVDSKVGTADSCCFCKTRLLNLLYENYQMSIKNYKKICVNATQEDSLQVSSIIKAGQPYLTSEQAKSILRNCWKNESTLLRNMYPVLDRDDIEFPTDLLFMQNLLVIPPKFRPCNVTRGLVMQHDLSLLYGQILSMVKCLRFLVSYKDKDTNDMPDTVKFLIKEFKGETWIEKSHSVWNEMQKLVTLILDTSGNRVTTISKGIRQVIEKKFGLFRQNLMGKRVNFSARSVAAPDPMLAVDEVGVPRDFAIKLSYPVPVNSHNVHELRELVINGPDKHPGAIIVEDEEGKKITLKANDENHRIAIANGLLTSAESCVNRVNASKIVYRHLKTGDWVLMNRQPTLHKPSIQAHKARVMPKDKVLRMPYANCKAYNADFDGDELNMHFPQNELARGECQGLVTTQNQYLTPRDGTPLAGLIQDCVVASVTLSKRGVFFNKADYQQLVFVGVSDFHRGKIKFLPPSIIKPQELWSGKQVFSTIILNLIPENKAKPTLTFKTAVKVDLWQEVEARPCIWGGEPEKRNVSMTESEFILRDGELLCGVVDKCAIGSTSHGLVHTCHDLYGGAVSSNILTSVGRMSVWYLQWSGHTICLKEFVTPPEVSKKRRKELKSLVKRAPGEVCKKLDITMEEFPSYIERHHLSKNEKEMAIIDAAYTSVLGPVTSRVTSENEKGLYRNNLSNRMRMMVDTGAKGSKVNMNQMASLFGSVALDGKRMTMSITGKTLPSFKPYDPSPRAGGYIPTRFVTGMDPKSYFFLCVVGRDSLQHTAVKTANSGYTQRCLIKHLEGLKVCYDLTVRNSDNVVMQFDYGEDGLEVTKVPFLKDSNSLNTLVDNFSRLIVDEDLRKLCGDERKLHKHKKKIMKYKEKTKYLPKTRNSGFLKFCKEFESKYNEKKYTEKGLNLTAKMWHRFTIEEREKYNSLVEECPEPVYAKYRFSSKSSLEGVSEAIDDLISSYYEDSYSRRPLAEQYLNKKKVTQTIQMKVLNSRVEPGEPVGALCAQALGEPLTQMTLNTFHFAGRDELNVTLGVPRMREILQMASDDSMMTPIMECPFHPHVSLAAAEALRKQFTPVELCKVVHQVNIEWALQMQYKLYRHTVIEFRFLPHNQYKKMLPLTPSKILEYMEKFFIKRVLIRQIVMAMQKANTYGADFLLKKMDRKEKEADENEEQIAVTTNLEVTEDSSGEEDNAEEVDDLGIAGSKWQEKGKEQDYNEDDDEVEPNEFFGSDGEAYESEGGIKVEIKHSEDEGFVDDRPEEENIKTPSSSKKKVKKVEKFVGSAKVCRVNKVIALDGWIHDYDYDEENMEWCKVTLCLPIAEGKYDLSSILRTTIENTLIYSVPNIKKALVVQNDGVNLLRTEGVNIDYILRFENYLDVNRLYTNNIHIMGRKFGIEAAQRSIIKEIRAVQSAYDIKVDFRHLSLLADYFTSEGKYKACSRHDLNNCASPVQKMSYETCFAFLKSALLQGHSDDMSSPSACVMAGQPVKVGTNAMFDIMCKLNGSCIK